MFKKISIVLLIIMGINYVPIFYYREFGDDELYPTIYYLCSFLTLFVLEYSLYKQIPFRRIIDKTLMLLWCISTLINIVDFLVTWDLQSSVIQGVIIMIIITFFILKKDAYEINNYKSAKINDTDVYYVFYKPKDFKSLFLAVLGGFLYSGTMMYHNGRIKRFKRGKGYVEMNHSGDFGEGYLVVKSSNPIKALSISSKMLKHNAKWRLFKLNCYTPIRLAENIDTIVPYSIFKKCYHNN